ncbi:hypothetical protein [Oscillibacter sp. MSJ-31]|uniref:hypothetical protein n=1 Tax=Oscillibacter sp. MSJ-31 TaxID=2841526 RepID=UPI001C124330|nr:hypothetical protein [Oscillibacter sp. MSJ-31]MBU5457547.1 hypothetical protein [Oscillibacter sp. MSJ-31]
MKRIKSKKNHVICDDNYKRGYEEGKRYKNHSDKNHIHWGFEGTIITSLCWAMMISLISFVIMSIPELRSWSLSLNPRFSIFLYGGIYIGSFVIYPLLLLKIFER